MPNAPETEIDERVVPQDDLTEAERKAAALPEGHLVRYIAACKKEAGDATKLERVRWRDLFRLWEGWRDFSKKEEWQSQIAIEKPFTSVEQATAQIQRALLDSPEFLSAVGRTGGKDLSIQLWERYLKGALDIVHFVPKFTDALQVGFITGISNYLRPYWTSYEVYTPDGLQQVSFLRIRKILPWKVFRDPDSQPREQWSGDYIIHSDWADIARLRRVKAYINTDRVLASPQQPLDEDLVDSERMRDWHRHEFRKATIIDDFWGNILDENGDLVLRDGHMTGAGQVLIKKPRLNPIWSIDPNTGRRRWPLIGFSPFTHPNRFEGRGILQQIDLLSRLYENCFNIGFDGMALSFLKQLQGDPSNLADPTDTKIQPGKFFALKRGVQGKVLEEVATGEVNVPGWIALLSYIDQVTQNNSFVSDFVIGLPGYRQEITKGEVQIKTAQSLAIFDRMGRNIELGGRQFAELVYDMLVQFTDETAVPVIGNMLPPEAVIALAAATPSERWNLLRADMQINFTGVTQALMRTDLLQRLMQAATLAQQPMFAPGVKNPSQILRAVIDLLGLNDRIDVIDAPNPLAQATTEPGSVVPGGPEPSEAGVGLPTIPPVSRPTQEQVVPVG